VYEGQPAKYHTISVHEKSPCSDAIPGANGVRKILNTSRYRNWELEA
jgi:hypothetical protein